MKKLRYIQLFEEFITEGDPLADLGGGGEEAPKEDPLAKKKKEDQAKEKKAKEKHNKMVDKKEDTLEDLFQKAPFLPDDIRKKIEKATEEQDRVLIHNCVNDLIYLQAKLQQDGEEDKVMILSRMKTVIDTLDKSFTQDKRM